jgi:uncharacterized protein YqfB (UPF0267 family)
MVTTPKIGALGSIVPVKTTTLKPKDVSTSKFSSKESSATKPTGETYQTFSVSALSTLMFDEGAKRHQHQAVVYGNDLLDQLEKIRKGLISGTISPADIQDLIQKLKNRPNLSIDPQLEELIREIETRAAVELAKLES